MTDEERLMIQNVLANPPNSDLGDVAEDGEEIDCSSTDEIVCPYCGHEHRDSWEMLDGHSDCGKVDCGECEREFEVSRYVSVSYTSYPIEGAVRR